MLKKYYLQLSILMFLSLSMLYPYKAFTDNKKQDKQAIQNKILIKHIGFETPSELSSWQVTKGSITRSSYHHKQGEYSARWQWKKNDILEIKNLEGLNKACSYYPGGQAEIYEPAYYEKGLYGGIKMWVYQEKPSIGHMVFQIGSDIKAATENPKYRFKVNLNFTGWRAVWVQLNEDAKIENYKGDSIMNSLIAFPSKTNKKGDLYIDHFNLLEFISYKRHSDMIIQNKKKGKHNDSYVILNAYKKYLNNKIQTNTNKDCSNQYNIISDRLEYLILGNNNKIWKKVMPELEDLMYKRLKKANKTYKKLNITIENNIINGTSLFSSRDEHATNNCGYYQAVAESTFFSFALDYRINKNYDSRTKFINLCKYFADQGWAAGSAMGTVDHIIRLNGFASSILLMKNQLSTKELALQQEMLVWHTRLGNIIDIDKSLGENTDLVRGGAIPKLISILLMPDGAKKYTYLKAFQEYINYVSAFSPGFSDTVKPDFSIYHHRGPYLNSYGVSTINTLAMIRWILKDTDFAMNEKSENIINKTLKKQYQIAYGVDIHFGASGRFPTKNSSINRFMLPAYAFMSTKDNKVIDSEMAGIFNYLYKISNPSDIKGILFPALTYSGTFGTVNLMYELSIKEGNKTIKPKNGTFTMPYSSLLVHRDNNFYATVKGYSKYVWDYETGHKNENNLGRYQSFGALICLKTGAEKGIKGAGINLSKAYDWSYLPGATTKALPPEILYHVNKPTKKYLEGYHRSYAETTFANGLNTKSKNGIFAMELRDDVKPDKDMVLFDSTFRAKKSYFFFGNEIICMGSNINNIDNRYNTVTTLFQNNIGIHGIQNKETIINGKSIGKSLEYKNTIQNGIIADVQGIYYVLPNNQNIIIEQKKQSSYTIKNRKYKLENLAHVKAWINHGKHPQDKSYQYQILLDANNEKAEQEYKHSSYEVLEKGATAHIVKHKAKNITGYAIFDAQEFNNKGQIVSVDTPCLVMIENQAKNMNLSVANPDLNMMPWNHNMSMMPNSIVHQYAKASIVSITLKGLWKPAGYVYELMSADIIDGNTIIKVFCRDGKTIEIPLRNKN